MKELPSVMPSEDLLNGFQTSHNDGQLFQINLCSLNVSKSHRHINNMHIGTCLFLDIFMHIGT